MRPFTPTELRSMDLRHFRLSPLPEVSRDFGHSTVILDRVASEHSATLCERMRLAGMRVASSTSPKD